MFLGHSQYNQGYIYYKIRDIMGDEKSGILKRGKKNQGEEKKEEGEKEG